MIVDEGDPYSALLVNKSVNRLKAKGIFGKVDEAQLNEVSSLTSFSIGEDVKVMDGPFNGFTGSISEIFEEKKKVNVTVKIFGRNTPVELNYFQVEKEN